MSTAIRLKEYLEYKQIAPSNAEKECDISVGGISKQLPSEDRPQGGSIGSSNLEKILSKYSDLSSEWLLRGEGSMLMSGNKAKELENKIAIMSKGRPNKDAAYDVILSIADMVSKTYDFFGGNVVLSDKEREDKMMDILNDKS